MSSEACIRNRIIFHVYKNSHGQKIAISPLLVCVAFINSNVLSGVACPPRLVEVGPEQHLTINVQKVLGYIFKLLIFSMA